METSEQGSTYKQWLVAVLVNTALLSYGLQLGWIACSARTLQSPASPIGTALTDTQLSWLASAPSFSATISVGVYTYLVDKYGRRSCIVMITVFQSICWIIKLCPANTTSLIVARICAGIGGGGCFNVIPMYVKEISQDNLRGTLGMLLIFGQNIGVFLMYAMGGYLAYNTVLWIVVGLPIITTVSMFRAPESPSFLVKVGKSDEAAATIAYLRGRSVDDKVVQSELYVIKSDDERFKSIPNVTYLEIFKHKAWGRGFMIMIMLMLCHGLNGSFAIVNYASIILAKSGVTVSLELQALSIPVFMIFGCLLSMVCIERLGRKVILSGSFIVSMVSFLVLSGTQLVQQWGTAAPGWVAVLVILLAVSSYAAGVSPLPFVIMSEMFNFQIRAKVMGVLVTLGWLFSFVQLLAFEPITSTYGAHVSFLCFAVINLVGAVVVLVLLPETRGRSIDEIELLLEKRLDNK